MSDRRARGDAARGGAPAATPFLEVRDLWKAFDMGTKSIEVLRGLSWSLERGAQVSYHDPYIPELTVGDEVLRSVELTEEVLREVDCLFVHTGHSTYEWAELARCADLAVDARNIMPGASR